VLISWYCEVFAYQNYRKTVDKEVLKEFLRQPVFVEAHIHGNIHLKRKPVEVCASFAVLL
jgi:hypothetical protein